MEEWSKKASILLIFIEILNASNKEILQIIELLEMMFCKS